MHMEGRGQIFTHCLESLLVLLSWFEIRGHNREPDHDTLVASSCNTFKDAVGYESHVE